MWMLDLIDREKLDININCNETKIYSEEASITKYSNCLYNWIK